MKILFLDVDGVLNRCGLSGQGLETDKCELLRKIIAETGASIVVSSTWRIHPHLMERLRKLFSSIGAECLGVTTYGLPSRGAEIQHWLDTYQYKANFVIVDDDSDMAHLLPHLIKTESYVGLTEEIAEEIIRRLNNGTILGQN